MNERYSLNSILDAIEDINTKPNNKSITLKKNNTTAIKKKYSDNENLLPVTEKLILEAEKHSLQLKNKLADTAPKAPNEDVLVLDNEYNDQDLTSDNFEKIKLNIIDDLYSTLSKKVKKKTLKTIFDLRHKITSLEKEIIVLSSIDTNNNFISDYSENNSNEDVEKEHLINENYLEENETYFDNLKEDDLSKSVIETLKLQDNVIRNLKKNEEKFLLKIIDLEQNLTISNNKNNLKTQIKEINKAPNFDLAKPDNSIDQLKAKSISESFFFKENMKD